TPKETTSPRFECVAFDEGTATLTGTFAGTMPGQLASVNVSYLTTFTDAGTSGFVCIDHRCTTAPDAPAAPPCESDEDCSATTAYCSDERICVECLRSEHCGPIEPVCDAMHSCRVCRGDNECASSVCDHATGACVSEAAILYATPSGGAQAT